MIVKNNGLMKWKEKKTSLTGIDEDSQITYNVENLQESESLWRLQFGMKSIGDLNSEE